MTREELIEIFNIEEEDGMFIEGKHTDEAIVGVSEDLSHIIYDYNLLSDAFSQEIPGTVHQGLS